MVIQEYWESQSKAGRGNRCLCCGEVHISGLDCENLGDIEDKDEVEEYYKTVQDDLEREVKEGEYGG